MPKARSSISKKTRFEVFKRDSFKCQYCGNKSPDVVLVLDHIKPVASGGTNNILNLITSCQPCNAGKSDRKLSDNQVLEKQRGQLEALQARREQLEMIMKWQESLQDEKAMLGDFWAAQWLNFCGPKFAFTLSNSGKSELVKLFQKYGAQVLSEAMEKAASKLRPESSINAVNDCFDMISKQCGWIQLRKENPVKAKLLYIAGIAANKQRYRPWDKARIYNSLETLHGAGVEIADLEQDAKALTHKEWSEAYGTPLA